MTEALNLLDLVRDDLVRVESKMLTIGGDGVGGAAGADAQALANAIRKPPDKARFIIFSLSPSVIDQPAQTFGFLPIQG